jgi:hypothetical protein
MSGVQQSEQEREQMGWVGDVWVARGRGGAKEGAGVGSRAEGGLLEGEAAGCRQLHLPVCAHSAPAPSPFMPPPLICLPRRWTACKPS